VRTVYACDRASDYVVEAGISQSPVAVLDVDRLTDQHGSHSKQRQLQAALEALQAESMVWPEAQVAEASPSIVVPAPLSLAEDR